MQKVLFIFLVFCGICCFLYGVAHILDMEKNACQMTYMFGMPQFLRIETSIDSVFPNYGLYYYYEGRPISNPKSVSYRGAPVLFVPGNGGSYKQVRSLASVALRTRLDAGRKRLDYFTINYNEELTALHGGYLKNQQLFLQHCIERIFKLYKEAKQVVLIGHSMGGKLAQSMLMYNNSLSQVINTMLFIASPLDAPVVDVDPAMHKFYKDTNRFLAEHRRLNPLNILQLNKDHKDSTGEDINDIVLVSIGGGHRDLMVTDSLTTSRYSDVHAMTSSIPKVWLSCDHLAAVWCLQLVSVINSFLFNIVNEESHLIKDKETRLRNANIFFGYGSSAVNYVGKLKDSGAIWEEDTRSYYTKVYDAGRKLTHYHMIPVNKFSETIFVEVENLMYDDNWIYGCIFLNSTLPHCEDSINLSDSSIQIPTVELRRFVITIKLSDFIYSNKNWTHIIIRIPPSGKKFKLYINRYEPFEGTKIILEDNFLPAPIFRETLIESIEGKAHYTLLFPNLREVTQAVTLFVEPQNSCRHFYTTAKFSTPWAKGFEQYHHQQEQSLRFSISVPVATPEGFNSADNPANVELFLDPLCRYKISYQLSFGGSMSKIVRHYFQHIPAYVTAFLLLAFGKQLSINQSKGNSLNFRSFASTVLQPTVTVVPTVTSLALYRSLQFLAILPRQDNSSHCSLVVLIICSTALVMTLLIVMIVWLCLLFTSSIARIFGIWMKLSAYLAHSPNSLGRLLSFSLAVAVVSIACYTTGGIALILFCVMYSLRISRLCEYYNRENLKHKNTTADFAHIHIHISLLLFLLLMILLNLPATVAYLKSWHSHANSRGSLTDHTLVPSLIILSSISVSGNLESINVPRVNNFVRCMLYICAFISIVYCQETIYLLTYVITIIFAIISIPQLFFTIFTYFTC